MVDITTHVSIPPECTTPRVHSNINCELWVITMCQFRLISCNKCTHSAGGAGILMVRDAAHVWRQGVYGNFLHLLLKFKTKSLKNKKK